MHDIRRETVLKSPEERSAAGEAIHRFLEQRPEIDICNHLAARRGGRSPLGFRVVATERERRKIYEGA